MIILDMFQEIRVMNDKMLSHKPQQSCVVDHEYYYRIKDLARVLQDQI